ncbi:AAA domain-containing protein [Fulvivirga maritima]|uniref:AAA domain-containing protein n=1 Tax=Fulvivirga maritima TaxID=2904247 RepID=UPI001F3557E8|nr:AAA domain-containing protein [Fulvivirga maritima]UII28778.1 AAA domain-containing protein [Fulvivirga maritima]
MTDDFKHLAALLKKEKEEDLLQYKLKMTGTSFNERRKQGVCWYPVFLDRTKFDAGERLVVKVSRPKEHTESHMFSSGKLVSLFSTAGDNSETEETVSGVVNYVNKQEMMITLNHDFAPDWLRDGNLGVQLLFDESSYREMEKVLKYLAKTDSGRINQLKKILLGGSEAGFKKLDQLNSPGLNPSQNDALNLVNRAQDVAIIHGPPGTGKTTTLIEAILQTLKQERQTLVCAPSNAAVDLLVEKLGEHGVNVLRIGHPARVTEETLSKTLDVKVAHHPDYKELKNLKRKAEEYRSLGKKYKRNFGHAERQQRRMLLDEARSLKDDADQLSYYITNDILNKSQVIACTLVGASNNVIKGISFNTVFIDEAAQALEPACWIPIIKAERVIFAGDHQQLPPTIKSFQAAKEGLEVTLFEKAIKNNKADVMLKEQYRMHTDIMNFSSSIFYNNELIANKNVASWTVFEGDLAVEFIDTAGCGYFEQVDPESKSSFNKEEAELLGTHLKQYIEQIEAVGKIDEVESVGVIAPYKAQTGALVDHLLDNKHLPESIIDKTDINTIDSFQGQERDIIYITLVRSNEKGEIGFLSNTRRMNVAMTRARKKLVVIGDSATIGQHEFYAAFLDYVNEIGAYKSAFEYIY